jgi:hypothetical protein
MPERTPPSPKLTSSGGVARAHWYPYYAGYAPLFVADLLRRQRIGRRLDDMVLDPWNGSGTTTTVCSAQNVPSRGFDLNPAMVVVAKARLLDANVAGSLPPLLEQVLSAAANYASAQGSTDPLCQWFRPATAARIRAIADSVQTLLVANTETARMVDINAISSIAAFFFVMLFRLVRQAARSLATSNPTWIRSSVPAAEKLQLKFDVLAKFMREDLKRIQLLDRQELQLRRASANIAIADSCALPIEDGIASAIITSPPYCTRIDYAVATRMELAVLGILSGDGAFDSLRRKMLGTTTVPPTVLRGTEPLSPWVEDLLARIAKTPSKASRSYYEPNYRDYFAKLTASCKEMRRVLRSEGLCTLVVQDSYFKDLHIDLAGCSEQIMSDLNFELTHRWDYESFRAMRDRRAKTRRVDKPVESVLVFRKV